MHIETKEQFDTLVAEIEGRPGYRKPQAWGVGIATLSPEGRMLSVSFPHPNFETGFDAVAIFADAVGHISGTDTYEIREIEQQMLLDAFYYHMNDGGVHPNIEAYLTLLGYIDIGNDIREEYMCGDSSRGLCQSLVVSFIDQVEHDTGSRTVGDAYLRFHLHSHGLTISRDLELERALRVISRNEESSDINRARQTPMNGIGMYEQTDIWVAEGYSEAVFDIGGIHDKNN